MKGSWKHRRADIGDTPQTPSPAWPYILLGICLLGVGVTAWQPIPAGIWHDDGVYMLVGKALASGQGLVYDGVAGTPPAAKFPPLYPGVLAVLWAVFGSIGAVTMAATFLNLSLLAIAGALFAKAIHESTELSLRMSAAAAGLAFVSTDLLRTGLIALSEPLFLVLMMAALALWPSVASTESTDTESWKPDGRLIALSFVLAASVTARSAALALVLAFAIALLVRRRVRTAVIATAPALIVMVAWNRWATAASASIPEASRDLLGPYGSWFADQTVAAPIAFMSGLPTHAQGVFERVAALFLPGLTGWTLILAALPLGAVAAFGIWRMLDRFPPLGWLTLGYLGMLMLWPYLDRRLVVPLHPALVAAVALGASEIVARARRPQVAKAVILAASAWVAGYSAVTAYRIADGWPTAPYRLRSDRLATAVEALSQTAPPDAVIGAPEFWAALHLHGGWTVSPSVRFDPRRVDPDAPMWGTPEEQVTMWQTAGIDHLLLEQAGLLHGAALDQLEAACPGSIVVLAQMPSAIAVRIDWDSDCPGAPSGIP